MSVDFCAQGILGNIGLTSTLTMLFPDSWSDKMMNRICGMTSSKAAVAALLCCVSALVTGCSTSQFIGPPDNSPVTGAAIEGVVHGGQNPVIGASVQLWEIGRAWCREREEIS